MRRLYALLFLIACTVPLKAQIVANNDAAFNANAYLGGTLGQANSYYAMNVLSNDRLNGLSVWQLVTLTQLSTTHPGVNVNAFGALDIDQSTPAGTYTITYQICENANPTNCDTATLTVEVCSQPAPTISHTDANCSTPTGTITLSGLPAGNWTILKKDGFNGQWQPVNGSGTSYTFSGLDIDCFYFQVVSDNCTSGVVSECISYPYGLDVEFNGTYVDLNADGAVNLGDIVNYSIGLVNSLNCPITNLNIVETSLNTVGGPVASIAPNSTDYSLTATYALTQADINSGSDYQLMWVSGQSPAGNQYTKGGGSTPLGISDGIRMHAFFDVNNNGIQDPVETDCTLGTFHYQMNNDGINHDLSTNVSDVTLYESNPANSYDFGYTISNIYCGAQYVVGPEHSNVTVASGSGIMTYHFPITIVPCVDVGIYITEIQGWPRPGFPYGNRILYKNHGNATASGTISFTKPAVAAIASVSETVTNTAGGFTFNYTNLLPGQTRYIDVAFGVLPVATVAIGDILTANAAITVSGSDSELANNNYTVTQEVIGAWDPNDKAESHGGKILHSSFTANDYLTYTIRFENTGNANAITVKLVDELDTKLDENSLRMIDASHNYVLDRTGRMLTWKFDGIDLPPSLADSPTGKGYVVFQVKPKPGYAVGDIIPNTASIYFDFNTAVVTNTVDTEFVSVLGVAQFDADVLRVYPNPVQNVLNIDLKNAISGAVQINDMLGKTIEVKSLDGPNTRLDLSGLSGGMYFVKVQAAENEKTFKIIKQ